MYLLLNLACAWAQGSDFESKGDNKSSSGVARIQPQAFQEPRLNTWSQTDWGIEDQAKTLNWTARLMSEHSAHLPPLPELNLGIQIPI